MTVGEIRPPLPADLRRRVLVEAGHRCAIRTCRHTDVDIHHIVPWSKCREHRFENLIALCPNCHRRADSGEIDNKSLQIYKARLAAAFKVEEFEIYPAEANTAPTFSWLDPRVRWRTRTKETADASRRFEAQLEYPEFRFGSVEANPLNRFISAEVEAILHKFQTDVVFSPQAHPSSLGYEISSSFAVSLLTEEFVSVRFTFHAYSGGAHGSTWTKSVNAYFSPLTVLQTSDLFIDSLKGLGAISDYCIGDLLDPSLHSYPHDEAWVKRGAGPEWRNFSQFNLTNHGLLFTFDEYQIDCYAAGRSEVLVPYKTIESVIRDRLLKVVGE